MTYAPASIEAMGQALSKHVDGLVVVFTSSNAGGSQRYEEFGVLGEDVVEALSEQDSAFKIYPFDGSGDDFHREMEELAANLPDTGLLGLTAEVFQNGNSNGANTFGTDSQ